MLTLTQQLCAGVYNLQYRPRGTDGGDRQGGELVHDAALPAALVQEILAVGFTLKAGGCHSVVADDVADVVDASSPPQAPQVSVAFSME